MSPLGCIKMKTDTKQFYEKNTHILESSANVCYEDLVSMSPEGFRSWVIHMRREILRIWDDYGLPPRSGGKSESEIIDQFNRMHQYPVHNFVKSDGLCDVGDDVITNTSGIGVEADQWFDNMYKTRINRTDKDDGFSVYDLFNDDAYLESVVKRSFRHFRRDGMYIHAQSVKKSDKKSGLISAKTAVEWIDAYFNNPKIFKNHDFILEEVKPPEGKNAGYFQLDETDLLHLTPEQLEAYRDAGRLEYRHHSTFDISSINPDRLYRVRMYEKGRKIFPKGFIPFRIGYIQPAVNFPPLTAKYLYERFTNHIKDQEVINVYDPSAGWGGRILGAMSVRDDRSIHYVGTDPNPDNFNDDGTYSKYAALADFYNSKTYKGNAFFSHTNTYEIFRECSEEIHRRPEFQKYKGKIDLIFTSPPYFNREAYSEDSNQSYKKHGSSYTAWKEGFLRPTLETCVEYLRSDRYLLWNIADLRLDNKTYLPLEQDSRDILEGLGMSYVMTIKMAQVGMPGSNRLDSEGKPHVKNHCLVGDKYMKYEPVFVFKKTY
jgi:hypothetical protein